MNLLFLLRGPPSLRGQQASQALWEGKRRRRKRQVNFETSRPLEPASSAVHSIGVVSIPNFIE